MPCSFRSEACCGAGGHRWASRTLLSASRCRALATMKSIIRFVSHGRRLVTRDEGIGEKWPAGGHRGVGHLSGMSVTMASASISTIMAGSTRRPT